MKLKFAGQLLDAEWKPTHFCIDETDDLKRGRRVMLIEALDCIDPDSTDDGLAVYAFKSSKNRIKLSFHTEFNHCFMPIAVLHD